MKHDAADRFMRDTTGGRNSTERFLLLHHTLHHRRPLGSGKTVCRLLWPWPPLLDHRRRASLSWFLRSLAGAGPCDTMCPTGPGRERKLVTEDSKPVGSGLIIYSSFSYYKKLRSFASTSPACAGSRVSACSPTPFSETLLMPPLPPNSARMGLPFVLFSHHPHKDRPRSQHNFSASARDCKEHGILLR